MDAAVPPAQHSDPASESAAATPSSEMTPTETGHPAVDSAVSRLATLDQLPLDEHAAVFDEIQRALATVLEAPLDAQQART